MNLKRAYELAAEQFERGADVVFGAAGFAGLGCIQAARDHGRYVVGVDLDQTEYAAPRLRDFILTSCLKNFEMLVSAVFKNYMDGTLEFGKTGRLGLKEGAVGIARWNRFYLSIAPKDVRDRIDDLEEKIINGSIHAQSAFDMTQEEIEELLGSVKR